MATMPYRCPTRQPNTTSVSAGSAWDAVVGRLALKFLRHRVMHLQPETI